MHGNTMKRSIPPTRLAHPHGCQTAQGFTLLELLVVILIIGLLTGIVAPRFQGQIARSEATAAKAQLDAALLHNPAEVEFPLTPDGVTPRGASPGCPGG
jgi:prepilin-type N-terminal cleavage/methylation domain-containing protein